MRRLIARADSWTGAGALFALALIAYWVEALAWPLQRGRDYWDYWLYWLQLADRHPLFWPVMVFRTPLTPIVTGLPMTIGGAQFLEIVVSLIYALSVVGWAWAARPFGRAAAVGVAVVVIVLQLPYAALFHLVSSDFVFAALLPWWAGFLVRAVLRPSRKVLVAVGFGAALLTLARPPGQILVVAVALAALVASGSLQLRVMHLAVGVAAAVLPLVAWAGVNSIRYDDFTVARGSKAWVPFFKEFGEGRIDPTAGSGARKLAELIRRDVLTLPKYRRDHVDVKTYLRATSNFETIRLIALSDRVFGRSDNYSVLYDAATESIRKHPGPYFDSVAHTYWDFLSQGFALSRVRRAHVYPPQPAVGVVDGKPIPRPIALSPMKDAVRYGFVWCPTDDIQRCIFHHPSLVFPSSRDQRRYARLTAHIRSWNAQLPLRDGKEWLASKLDALSLRVPRAIVWLVIGIASLALRRPRGALALLVLLVGAALVLGVHALSQSPQPEFELPFAPLFVLVAVAALAGPRRTRAA